MNKKKEQELIFDCNFSRSTLCSKTCFFLTFFSSEALYLQLNNTISDEAKTYEIAWEAILHECEKKLQLCYDESSLFDLVTNNKHIS